MRDYLLDIVKHTRSVGNIDAVKVTDGLVVEAKDDDNKVIVKATYKAAPPELNGVLGLPNLDKLNIILNIPEYKENAKISVENRERNGEETPFSMKFENASGDFKNDFRFMSKELVTQRIPEVRFKGANWDVEFEPHSASVQRFKFQSQANSEESVFIAKTEDDNLKFYFGDDSGHTGNLVFQAGVTGSLKQSWKYPVAEVLNVLNINGDITMRFSDNGALKIDVDNGMAVYEYIFPAQS
jgi:hypothetical protein|tara:strand:- start:1894 stop:2613 length:720 start_codon:yes stop_codon:yes gene_type:complete